ncbi:hypothetical protein JKP88DRAFT_277146 [Tribonema minus]|uniref:Uncharacterized protein n=1 Tax=Tribonema minus TaxID=303371 RepID=A0A835Z3J8_9STRA|nr:hypothetical protein JKP88DRAFT_277146 [Tribonema minus]
MGRESLPMLTERTLASGEVRLFSGTMRQQQQQQQQRWLVSAAPGGDGDKDLRTQLQDFMGKLDTLATKESIKVLEQSMDAKFQSMDAKFEGVNSRFKVLEQSMDAKFEGVNSKFKVLEQSLDAKFEGVNSKFKVLEQSLDAKFQVVYHKLRKSDMSVEGIVNRAVIQQLVREGWGVKHVELPVAGKLNDGVIANPHKLSTHAFMEWGGLIAATRIVGGVEHHCLFVTDGEVHVKGHKIDGPPTAKFSDAPLSQRRIRLEQYITEVVSYEEWVNEDARAQGERRQWRRRRQRGRASRGAYAVARGVGALAPAGKSVLGYVHTLNAAPGGAARGGDGVEFLKLEQVVTLPGGSGLQQPIALPASETCCRYDASPYLYSC